MTTERPMISRLKVVVLTILLNVTAVVMFAHMPGSDWRTGAALNILDNAILVAYAVIRRDRLMAHLLIFGVALGLTELIADAWLVDWTKTLDYSIGGGPMIWRSPLWMPFAWEVVAVQFAVLGMWFTGKFRGKGVVVTALIGTVNIPFYEEMALKTHWWVYNQCRMFLHTPYYIILGEFLIVIFVVILSRSVEQERLKRTWLAGMGAGLSILLCYAFAYWVLERLI
jgi:hypothetical protein